MNGSILETALEATDGANRRAFAQPMVLIIDDEPHVIHSLRFVLTRAGYLVDSAKNGEEALIKIGHVKPSLIILDIGLPRMDGYQVCRKVRANPELDDIHLLVLTAKGQEKDREEAFSAGADDYLTKPFSPKQLIGVMRTRFACSNRQDQDPSNPPS